jgi:hypothetical protein
LRYCWLKLLPVEWVGKNFAGIARLIKSGLRERPVFFGHDGQARLTSDKVVFVPAKMRLAEAPILSSIVSHKSDLSLTYDMNVELRKWLGIDAVDESIFLARLQKFLARQNGTCFQTQSEEWHESLAGILLDYVRNDRSKSLLKSLALIPLRDGSWARAAPSIFFAPNRKLDVASEELLKSFENISFVSEMTPDCNRHALVSKLGIEIAGDATIYAEIERLHKQSKPPTLLTKTLREHAIYLYEHRYFAKKSGLMSLWVASEGATVTRSSALYVDDEKATFREMGIGPKRLLHSSYRVHGPAIDPENWISWLSGTAGLSKVLRLITNGVVSQDFQQISKHADSTTWLPLLLQHWYQIENARTSDRKVQKTAAQILRSIPDGYDIKDIQVQTLGGGEARLCETYLPRPELLSIGDFDIKYLEVTNSEQQEWHKWKPLEQLGVVCSAQRLDVALRVLRGIKRSGKPRFDDIRTLYEDIQGHLKDSQACKQDKTAAYSLFKDEAHIWEPASGTWKSAAEFVWSTSFKLDFKISLAKIYPSCHTLFVQKLGIADADLGTVLADIVARPPPVDETDALRMIQLLTKLSAWTGSQDRAVALASLEALNEKHPQVLDAPLIPVKLGNQPTEFIGLEDAEDFFICDRKAWEGAFPQLYVMACSALQALSLAPLFELIIEASGLPDYLMSRRVSEEFDVGRGATTDEPTTRELRQKMGFIKRIIESNINGLTAEQKTKLAVIESVEVFCAPNMTVTPYLVDAYTSERQNGIPRHGGQFLPSETHCKGRFEIYADRSRLSRGAPFTNQLHKDLVQWLSISHEQTIDQIRDTLTSDDPDQIVEDLTLAGFQVRDLVAVKIPEPQTNRALWSSTVNSAKETSAPAVRTTAPELMVSSNVRDERSQRQPNLVANDLDADAPSNRARAGDDILTNGDTMQSAAVVAKDIETQTGIDGENFVADLLLRIFKIGPVLGRTNVRINDAETKFLQRIWTSELRHVAKPTLTEWTPEGKAVHADFTLKGKNGLLRQWLADKVNGEHVEWNDNTTFHIEVKTTRGVMTNEFHMSELQVKMAKDIAVDSEGQAAYLIFRVADMYALKVGREPKLKVIASPWHKYVDDEVDVRIPEGWVVRLRS